MVLFFLNIKVPLTLSKDTNRVILSIIRDFDIKILNFAKLYQFSPVMISCMIMSKVYHVLFVFLPVIVDFQVTKKTNLQKHLFHLYLFYVFVLVTIFFLYINLILIDILLVRGVHGTAQTVQTVRKTPYRTIKCGLEVP